MTARPHIAYLTNRYPATSHSFIRREIAAVEAAGAIVTPFSVRRSEAALPDARDRVERDRTTVLLDGRWLPLFGSVVAQLAVRPVQTLRAISIALHGADFSLRTLVRRMAYFAEAAAFARACARLKIDHVHAHFGTNPTFVARLARCMGGPHYSFTAHGPDEFDAPVALDLKGKVTDARFVVAISSFGRSQLMRWSDPLHWDRLKVVRCGVDEDFIGESQQGAVPAESLSLCCVARLSAQKGLPLLIEAAAIVRARGLDFRLCLVGDGELRTMIEARVAALGLNGNVEIVGWSDGATVRAHLLQSRAMVLPSFAEGLPVVIMEALALRRPVIVTGIAGTPELVDAGCGWVVPAGSVDALADAMVAALTATPGALAAMGEEGRRRVLASHDARLNGTAMYDLFVNATGQAA